MVLALSASISKQQRAQETSETIKRLMDLYEEREELQLEEGLKEQKREFDIVTGENKTQVLELIQSYHQVRSGRLWCSEMTSTTTPASATTGDMLCLCMEDIMESSRFTLTRRTMFTLATECCTSNLR